MYASLGLNDLMKAIIPIYPIVKMFLFVRKLFTFANVEDVALNSRMQIESEYYLHRDGHGDVDTHIFHYVLPLGHN